MQPEGGSALWSGWGAKAVGRRAGLHYLQVEGTVQTGEGNYVEKQEAQGHVGLGLLEPTRDKQQRARIPAVSKCMEPYNLPGSGAGNLAGRSSP